MAEENPNTRTPRRSRRSAGAPAGAPVESTAVAPSAEGVRTTVAAESATVVREAQPLNLRARRLAAKKAAQEGAAEPRPAEAVPAAEETPVSRVETAPVIDETPSAESEAPAFADEAPVATPELPLSIDGDAETGEDEESTAAPIEEEADATPSTGVDGIFADLRALADSTKESEPEEQSAPAMSTDDFASLLFRAPTKAEREAKEAAAQAAEDFEAASLAVAFDAPDLEAARRAAIERAERASKKASRDLRAPKPELEDAEEDGESDYDANAASEDSADAEESRSSRRRRRRGGRGRRGRGRNDDEQNEDSTPESEDSDDDEATSNEPDENEDADEASSSGSSRRRRRRRRTSTSRGDEPQPDDPPNTVVKVREGRDEVKAVKGSTRLEAKKQRRKEGRESGRRRHSITESEFLARRESVKRSMIVRERPGRTQIVVLEDNILVEHYVAQKAQTSMVGNVYLGKVQNVLPSMEAAFVDIGKGRNAVLYAGEVNWDAAGLEGQPRRIELALKPGDAVLVQVTKDPIGHKGARLTSQISLPGRYLVYVPGGSMTGISRKLPDKERSRLKKILKAIVPEEAGVIVRTAAEGASEEELTRDVQRLQKQWDKIQKANKSKNAPAALSTEPDLAIKVVRDIFNEDFTSLIVEGDSVYSELHEYISDVAPDLLDRVTKHVGKKDSFAKYRVDEQLMKAMDRKVYLPSGGSLVIDRTEAMTVVDVNTGKFTGSGGSLEETVTRNNLEAAEEIVRQLRLRDIGGIIVVDFIDMVLESNRDLVLRRMIECLSRDRTKHQVAEVTSLGLVQMTRKRVGAGLVETFSSMCEHCNGRGIQIDLDGQHHHEAPAFEDESSRRSRRRSKKSKGSEQPQEHPSEQRDSEVVAQERADAARETVRDLVDGKAASDVHRLEEDEESRALARATIASIAAASSTHGHPEVTVDGQVISVSDDQGEQPSAENSDA